MLLYFDASCLNRPFDDQSQSRIRLEAEAIVLLLELVDQGVHQHVSSEMAVIEINAAGADLKRQMVEMLPPAADIITLTDAIFERAGELEKLGLKPADAVHVAAAESWNADVLLSCDDRMCKIARRHARKLNVRVANPLVWLQEMSK